MSRASHVATFGPTSRPRPPTASDFIVTSGCGSSTAKADAAGGLMRRPQKRALVIHWNRYHFYSYPRLY